jgi:hypothetical protein
LHRPDHCSCRGFRSHRQPSQSVVEFGLSVAAVAFVALLGFGALGQAQAAYWGAPKPALNQPPPAVGTFSHKTQVSGSCTPTTLYATKANSLDCSSLRVTDLWTPPPGAPIAPKGHVQVTIDATLLTQTCSLQPDSSGGAFSTCPGFTESWTPALADIGAPHSLVAQYVPDGGDQGIHMTSSLTPPEPLSVASPVTITFSPATGTTTPCWNPFHVHGFTMPGQFEQGHPLICHLVVTDTATRSGVMTRVQVSDQVAPGDPGVGFFSCYTNNKLSALSSCNAAGSPYIGSTNSNGDLWFVYRRYYAALASGVPVRFIATTTTGASASICSAGCDEVQTIAVEPPADGAHPTQMVVDCTAAYVQSRYPFTAANGQAVQTVDKLEGPPGSLVVCTVVVFDTDHDLGQPFFAGANPDTEDLYGPLGTITWVDSGGRAIHDQSGNNAVCQPPVNPLTLGDTATGSKPPMYYGLPTDASSCTTTLKLTGDQTIYAIYTPASTPPSGNQGHLTTTSNAIEVDTDGD